MHGLNYNGKEEGFQFIIERISEINCRCGVNYSPAWAVLNVADYGVPQLRVRFFSDCCDKWQTLSFSSTNSHSY
ncbi:MAG: DNA cytosine methyltransferase [Hormoscilla sp. GM7CHS1pb]|nr:DNA cytosine methyltransferase [Hormoscilla sp. GM7CHS1pb]